MNVASLDRCEELYELSGWGRTGARTISDVQIWWIRAEDVINGTYFIDEGDWVVSPSVRGFNVNAEYFPAYDLGYLLRKLPKEFTTIGMSGGQWYAHHASRNAAKNKVAYADTPEDAAAKLAIELFKQKILTKENQ